MRSTRRPSRTIAVIVVPLLLAGSAAAGAQPVPESQDLPAWYPTWAAGAAQGPAEYISSWGTFGTGDANFDTPLGIAVRRDGQLIVADSGNDRIMHIYPSGDLIQQWGSAGTADGQFDDPCGVAVSDGGNEVYVSERGNDRVQVFRSDGVHLATFGGPGSGDGQFLDPCGVADRGFELYVADSGNDRVQVIDSFGVPVRSIGGTGSGPGRLEGPMDVAVGNDGRVAVADTGNHRVQVFTTQGSLLDVIDGFETPTGVAFDVDGNLYVVDSGADRVSRYNRAGQFLSRWGSPGAADGQLADPFGVAVSRFGTVNLTDTGNHRFQRWGWARPDAMIRRGASGRIVGNDVYNATGRRQTRHAWVEPGDDALFLVILEDTGVTQGSLRLRGGRSTRAGVVTYRSRGADVTEAVVAGTHQTGWVAPYRRAGVQIRVAVRPGAPTGAVVDRVLRADAVGAVGTDVVRFVVHVA